jgi:predicted DCC family thiol-disulfide oxidoreductase YuxK
MDKNLNKPVILYDGVCNFCNAIVQFILKKDKEKVFLFAPIQSREARALLREKGVPFASLKSIYLVNGEKVSMKSTAVFKIFKMLPAPWKSLSFFSVLPLALTDSVYALVAKYRYLIFGKSNEISAPQENLKERFL